MNPASHPMLPNRARRMPDVSATPSRGSGTLWLVPALLLLSVLLAAPAQAAVVEVLGPSGPSLDCVSVNLLPPDVGFYPDCVSPVGGAPPAPPSPTDP
jgi:hypothetical protein